jgi:hypothetical protein
MELAKNSPLLFHSPIFILFDFKELWLNHIFISFETKTKKRVRSVCKAFNSLILQITKWTINSENLEEYLNSPKPLDCKRILDDMATSESWDAWVHGNRAFHQKLYEASSSRRLVSLIKSLQDTQVLFVSATLSRSPTLKETATADHEAMLQAARDRDAETLTEVTLRHLTIPVRD